MSTRSEIVIELIVSESKFEEFLNKLEFEWRQIFCADGWTDFKSDGEHYLFYWDSIRGSGLENIHYILRDMEIPHHILEIYDGTSIYEYGSLPNSKWNVTKCISLSYDGKE